MTKRLITWRRLHSDAQLQGVKVVVWVKRCWARRNWRDHDSSWMIAASRLTWHQNHCQTLSPGTTTSRTNYTPLPVYKHRPMGVGGPNFNNFNEQ